LSEKIKNKYPGKIIQICGGVHVTIFPQAILSAKGLDGVFVGESELAFSDFLDRVERGLPFVDICNFAYDDNGVLKKNTLYPLITDLDSIPFPERDKYHYERFIKRDGYAVFMFSRGCPFSCTYCSNHALAKTYNMPVNKPRFRSPENCIIEIKQLIGKFSIKKVFIGDDTFGLDKEWTREFCKKYAEEIRLPLICQLRVNLVDEELMRLLKHAGCIWVSCGVESGSPYIRNKIMKRNITNEQIINAYALFKKYKLISNAINIIGLPHETEKEIWETIELNAKINPTSSGVNIFYPYRGTELGDYCFAKGMVNESAYEKFSSERRESILNFPGEYQKTLIRIHDNWRYLVYKRHPQKLIAYLVKKTLKSFIKKLYDFSSKLKNKVKFIKNQKK
ncbi:MAG: B12-binding domain-containing radical SAM protein, partial [Candidatus Margulisbacteria bacterium]|nr:B12-binding domain-containing radical SAM protein [Candidatus Margulisiibacteriota bacterium]